MAARMVLSIVMILVSVMPARAQVTAAALEKVLVRGTVTGFDGKPVEEAHAHFLRLPWGSNTRHQYTIEVGVNGKYMMKLPEGLYQMSFTGVNHQRTTPVTVFSREGTGEHHQRAPAAFAVLRGGGTGFGGNQL